MLKRFASAILEVVGNRGSIYCLDEVKYVLALPDYTKDRLLVEAIIDCAKKFDIATCAEWGETLEHYNKLRELGVNRYQGHCFFEPVALPELKQYSLIHNG